MGFAWARHRIDSIDLLMEKVGQPNWLLIILYLILRRGYSILNIMKKVKTTNVWHSLEKYDV